MKARRSTFGLGVAAGLVHLFAADTIAAASETPEPHGAHPRIFLDAKNRASMKEAARDPASAIARTIRQCTKVTSNLEKEAKNSYMGFNWAAHATNCALAWHATGDAAHAKTAIHFFTALLDDWAVVGDGKGGDTAVRHDSG